MSLPQPGVIGVAVDVTLVAAAVSIVDVFILLERSSFLLDCC